MTALIQIRCKICGEVIPGVDMRRSLCGKESCHKKNGSEVHKKWYHGLPPEEKEIYNQGKYQKYQKFQRLENKAASGAN